MLGEAIPEIVSQGLLRHSIPRKDVNLPEIASSQAPRLPDGSQAKSITL